jgi:hypothetical protein
MTKKNIAKPVTVKNIVKPVNKIAIDKNSPQIITEWSIDKVVYDLNWFLIRRKVITTTKTIRNFIYGNNSGINNRVYDNKLIKFFKQIYYSYVYYWDYNINNKVNVEALEQCGNVGKWFVGDK